MVCPRCATESLSPEARFCTRCGAPLPSARPSKVLSAVRFLALPLILAGRALAYPSSCGKSEAAGSLRRADSILPSMTFTASATKRTECTPTWRASRCAWAPRIPASIPSRRSPASRSTRPARQSPSLNGAGSFHTDAGIHGMVAGRTRTTSSGSPTDSPGDSVRF